jgi:sporulation integral membrane protein YlbJ
VIVLFYVLIFIILLILCFSIRNINILITIICTILIGQIILSPKICIDGVISGAMLFFYKVFPSLFSFLVVSNIILFYDGVYIYSKLIGRFLCKPLRLPINCSFVLIISMLCGYPLGAKYACDLLERRLIDLPTCERLLNIASNASPLFVLGSVGISMFKNSTLGYILLLSNLLSCIAMGFLLKPEKIYIDNRPEKNHVYSNENIGKVIKSSIENAIKTCMSIGGFVIIFSVVNNILKNNFLFSSLIQWISKFTAFPGDIIEGFLLGIIEMTNGCNLISSSTASLNLKIIIVSFLFTFSGVSIISQVYSFTYRFKISMKKYILGKIFQGIICSILSFSIYNVFFNKLSASAFLPYYKIAGDSSSVFLLILVLIILPWLIFRTAKLFHIP